MLYVIVPLPDAPPLPVALPVPPLPDMPPVPLTPPLPESPRAPPLPRATLPPLPFVPLVPPPPLGPDVRPPVPDVEPPEPPPPDLGVPPVPFIAVLAAASLCTPRPAVAATPDSDLPPSLAEPGVSSVHAPASMTQSAIDQPRSATAALQHDRSKGAPSAAPNGNAEANEHEDEAGGPAPGSTLDPAPAAARALGSAVRAAVLLFG